MKPRTRTKESAGSVDDLHDQQLVRIAKMAMRIFSRASQRKEALPKWSTGQMGLLDPEILPTLSQVYDNFTTVGEWRSFCGMNNVFELLTAEYMSGLSRYLTQRVSKLERHSDRPLTILEVGAGSGKLSEHLRRELEAHSSGGVQVVATDSYLEDITPVFRVERMHQQEALTRIQPDIVISSWMPMGTDWTQDFRKTSSVREYVLIGNSADVGLPWETWGAPFAVKPDGITYDHELAEQRYKSRKPYELDGFQRFEHSSLQSMQVCQDDGIAPAGRHWSQTVSFIRLDSLPELEGTA